MHNCLLCRKARDFYAPEYELETRRVRFVFTCTGGDLRGPYGRKVGVHTLQFWPESMTVGVIDGQEIPNDGCPKFSAKVKVPQTTEELRKIAAQRGARMQILREFMREGDWQQFCLIHPEAETWFDEDGIPVPHLRPE